jgi:hypothetical protein
MDTGFCRAHCIFPMQMIRENDVHCIDAGQGVPVILVRENLFEAVFFAYLPPFLRVAGNNGDQLRVVRCLECRQDRYLRKVPQSHDGVANFSTGFAMLSHVLLPFTIPPWMIPASKVL